jgi:hypothetical protein
MSTTTPSQQQIHRATDVVRLLQTAFPRNWEKHLRNLGVTDPADLAPAELAEFTDRVFWLVKQTGIKDPAAWLVTHRALMEASTAPVVPLKLEAPVEIAGDISVQPDSVKLEKVKFGLDPARTSSAPPPAPVAATVTSRTTRAELPRRGKAAMSEAIGPKPETTPLGAMDRKRARSGGRQIKKQKPPAEISKPGRKLTPERMRVVIESLREYPVLSRAASKAGIHRKTLEYWLKGSKAGDDRYDIEWQGVLWRFHEHYQTAIEEAYDKVLGPMWEFAMGGVVYKNDEFLLSLGCEGPEAYLRDENGIPIAETVRKPNGEMLRFLLAWWRPDEWGKRRKIDVPQKGGVHVLGATPKKRGNNSAASIKARKWKSGSRMIREAKA